MEFKDYYRTLGLEREAPAAEIKKAYRRLARKYHPDVSKEKDSDARMKELNEAYAALSDPEKRAAYDQFGRGYRPGQDFSPPPDWNRGRRYAGREFSSESADFSDFFSQMFGQRGGGPRREHRAQGADLRAKVTLDIEDAFEGPTRQITLRVPVNDDPARLENRTLGVKIPRGVREGQMIRLAGQGAAGIGGAPPGDLLLEVGFNPHPRYHIEGRDLHVKLPLAPWEAALGAVIPVQIPGSTLSVKVPAGTQGGKQLRVKGKGLPGREPGDLYIDLEVVLPPADTPEAKALYEQMSRELAFDPRTGGDRT